MSINNKTRLLILLAGVMLTLFAAATASAAADEFAPLYALKGPPARQIIEKPTLYRAVEMKDIACDMDEFEFLMERPNLSMALALLLDPELDKYRIKTRPDGSVYVNDNSRLVGEMELVSVRPGSRLYYIKGYWKFIWGITFEGRMAIVSDYVEKAGPTGTHMNLVTRSYIKVDNALVGIVARLVVYAFPGRVDARIKRFTGAIRRVSAAIRQDPEGVYRKLCATGELRPDDLAAYKSFFLDKVRTQGQGRRALSPQSHSSGN